MTSLTPAPLVRGFSRLRGTLWIGALSLVFGACAGEDAAPPQTASQRCNEVAAVECAKLYSCFNQQERFAVGLYPNQDGCTAQLSVNLNCSSATPAGVCKGVGTLDDAAQCIQQARAITCEQLRANITLMTMPSELPGKVASVAPKCVPCLVF